jgi:hypothetical protein
VGRELHFQPTHAFSPRGPLFPMPALTMGGHWSVGIPSPLSHVTSTAGGTGPPASDARSTTTQNHIAEICDGDQHNNHHRVFRPQLTIPDSTH